MWNSNSRWGGRGRQPWSPGRGSRLVACSDSGSSSSTRRSPRPRPPTAGGIKIGVLTTCGGPFATFEAESLSGAKYALVKDAGARPTARSRRTR